MARRSVCWKFQLFCLFIILLIQASKSIPSECTNYQILSDGTRSVQSTLNNENVLCDRSLSTGWYRFMGEAGTQLPEQPVGNIYFKPYSCHTHAVSWLTTPHPRFGEGSVSRTVCFSWNGDNCHYKSVSILVINCDGYFVYYLSGTPSCYYRYCANRGNTGSKTKVSCLHNYMGIELNRNFFNVSLYQAMTLRSKNCSAVINAANIILGSKLNSCGTTREENGTHIVYTNEAILHAKTEGSLISRVHDKVISFSCAYKRDGYTNTTSFIPNTRIDVSESHIGRFSFELEMHRDNSFNTPYSSYPVNVALQDQLYFQVKASAEDNSLVLLIDKCFSTPNMNRNDHRKYTFINNGCIVDNTAKFHPADHLKQRFSIQAFRYLTNYTAIYIHCLVLLCQRSSSDSRCISGCYGNNVNRARRDISSKTTTTSGAQSYSGYYLLDQGPISHIGDKRNSGNSGSDSSLKEIVIGLGCSIAVMVLIIAVLVIIMKRGKNKVHNSCKEEINIDNPTISKESMKC